MDAACKYPGIYYIDNMNAIPVQIVVIKELEPLEHSSLKILTRNADEDEIREFIKRYASADSPEDRNNADAVLQVSVSANRETYSRIAEDNNMCEALRELFKDEIDGLIANGEARALDAAVERLAAHYMSKDPNLSHDEAIKMASAILR